ncbi:hypothetical protein EDEG_00348 [Edhazardia aedis USNM 41457]|uniref:Uncharacterized protein n=1 Tax=Edhazardia aedis (strain USNM 41457) TaxID=1003232 RepID=J9D2L2_EDHAE|nr:hypothetical protein EDEG_00348 [Edhazardia aedis USNM 41457]|eukprot:EJW01824.1 hypothetical protein EDEG_00348 [Edhazardia aedis USNM 41457]
MNFIKITNQDKNMSVKYKTIEKSDNVNHLKQKNMQFIQSISSFSKLLFRKSVILSLMIILLDQVFKSINLNESAGNFSFLKMITTIFTVYVAYSLAKEIQPECKYDKEEKMSEFKNHTSNNSKNKKLLCFETQMGYFIEFLDTGGTQPIKIKDVREVDEKSKKMICKKNSKSEKNVIFIMFLYLKKILKIVFIWPFLVLTGLNRKFSNNTKSKDLSDNINSICFKLSNHRNQCLKNIEELNNELIDKKK